MVEPRVPGQRGTALRLPCGETVDAHEVDMGMREYACPCGGTHAVVLDVHPPTRFLPEFLVDVLRDGIETADAFDEFGTPHLMGLVLEDFPDAVVATDVSEDGQVGYAILWVTDFDARRLHEVIVELVVELMDHAVSHADDADRAAFDESLGSFDVAAFVDEYRRTRDLTADDVPGYERG